MELYATEAYTHWLDGLRDPLGRARILARVERLAGGNPGNHRMLKHGVAELKIDVGPGYRVYYQIRGSTLLLLLAGGDKSTQAEDIAAAYRMATDPGLLPA